MCLIDERGTENAGRTSAQGYKVNIIESGGEANSKTEKCAVLVADGIRYTLRGRVSIDTIKQIVDTLK